MNNKFEKIYSRSKWMLSACLLACAINSMAAVTDLASEPLVTQNSSQIVLPNLMFVLDDSGSMANAFMPDWADPLLSLYYLVASSDYNGVAYNPATYYRPPVMYTSSGALDTTTYPSQTAAHTANWTAVKNDGYGVQSTATTNLVGQALFYNIVAGEYCSTPQLRRCVASSASTTVSGVAYTFPAKLRWCTTSAQSLAQTSDVNDVCQASQIAATATNTTNGITSYSFARTPSLGSVTTLVLSGAGALNISNLTVNGNRIIASNISGNITSDPEDVKSLLNSMVQSINACTKVATGSCAVTGYSAGTDGSSTLIISAPGVITVTPVVTKTGAVTVTTSAFSKNVPGSILTTEVKSSVTSYPYPGLTTKAPTRTDCAGTACTYEEEMTNYANWWAYYHTRMQAMKTSASLAFSTVTEQFRVGYFSINNATGSDYLDIGTFDAAHKYAWYSKFFSAYPFGPTPLRTALSYAGQLYAGKRTSINTQTATDPMQYYCQQNFTLLSTDGYWNDAATPKKIDTTTDIGQQDGYDVRPYYDGATQTRTSEQFTEAKLQLGKTTWVNKSRTLQVQTREKLLKQMVQTDTTVPWHQTNYKLQSLTNYLSKTTKKLYATESYLYSTPQSLQKRESTLQTTTYPLQYREALLTKTTYPMIKTTYNITKVVYPVIQTSYYLTKTSYPLQSTKTQLVQKTYQLLSRTQTSTNGGDSYGPYTAWAQVSSCTEGTTTSGSTITIRKCRYQDDTEATTDSNLDSCTVVNGSTGPNYTVSAVTTCAYQSAGTPTTVSSCTIKTQSGSTSSPGTYQYGMSCGYGSSGTVLNTNLTSCSNNTPSSGTANNTVYSVATKEVCTYQGSGSPTTLAENGTCTAHNQDSASPYTTQVACAFSTGSNTYSGQTSCTANASNTATAKVTCTHESTAASTENLTVGSTCTYKTATSAPKVTCAYSSTAASTLSNQATCPSNNNTSTSNNAVWNDKVTCSYGSYGSWTNTSSACTYQAQSTSGTYQTARQCQYLSGTSSAVASGGSCTAVSKATSTSSGTVYNPAVDCFYQTGSWVDSGSCTVVGQSLSNPYNVTTARECRYVAGTATQSSTCTSTVQTGSSYTGNATSCGYVEGTTNEVTSCQPVARSAGPNYTVSPARVCAYGTGATVSNQTTCTPQSESSGTGLWVGPAVSCTYQTSGSWLDANSACTVQPQTSTTTNGQAANTTVNCRYVSTGTTDQNSCTRVNMDTSNNILGYSSTTAVACDYGPFTTTNSYTNWNQNSCTPSVTNPTVSVGTQTVTTTCDYQSWWGGWYNSPTCTSVPQTSIDTQNQVANKEIGCQVTDTGYVPVVSCSAVGSLPSTYDSTGKIVACDVVYPMTNLPAETCANATADASNGYTNTSCSTLYQQLATPVSSCSPGTSSTGDTGGSDAWIKTTCVHNLSNTTVSGCIPEAKSPPNWREVTCGALGGPPNTLADVAQYYYKTDLRTPTLNNCTAPNGETGALCPDTSVVESSKQFQRMITYTLGLGASGFMQYSPSYQSVNSPDLEVGSRDYNAVLNGTDVQDTASNTKPSLLSQGICNWQTSGVCNWPVPVSDDQTGIDDLWHAGVNGRGAYFSAGNPDALSSSLLNALASVAAQKGAQTSASISSANLYAGDNYVFISTFVSSDWYGDVSRFQVDVSTAGVTTVPDWSAQTRLDAKASSSRMIYTYDASAANKLKEFSTANFADNAYFKMPYISSGVEGLSQFLCTSITICLSSSDQAAAEGIPLINFIRGSRVNEGTENAKYFRLRKHVLGDIVNSQSAYIGIPNFGYADPGYNDYINTNVSRLPAVYVGANDGMLHAFRAKGSAAAEAAAAAAAADSVDTDLRSAADTALAADIANGVAGGEELWAYIPSPVIPHLYKLADKNYSTKHRYFVDGSVISGDICVDACATSAAVWKTIIVGGLNAGGRGYYAMDVTDPNSPKALWEFTNSNLGYTYGDPIISKLSDGTWVVFVSSGYNNVPNTDGAGGDGQGRLFVLNAATGALIRTINTGVGSATTPSGLGQISAQAVNPLSDNTTVAVYGGDMLGNLWRFDVNNTIGASGYDAQLLAKLASTDGTAQPITTHPVVSLVDNNIAVFVGTGRLLGATDLADETVQTIYGIKDPRAADTDPATPIYNNPRSLVNSGESVNGFVKQTISFGTCPSDAVAAELCLSGETVAMATSNPVSFATGSGWLLDLPRDRERANVDMALVNSMLGIVTNAPNNEACTLGGTSYFYLLDYKTGGPLTTNGMAGVTLGNFLSSGAQAVVTSDGQIKWVILDSTGTAHTKGSPNKLPGGQVRRTSWRELIEGQ